jgi:hypothetical protein
MVCKRRETLAMGLTLHRASVPVFVNSLTNLSNILELGDAYAAERGLDASTLLQARLAPDMFPFVRQVQIASDHARVGSARLAGCQAPPFAEDETSFEQLRSRIARTIDFISALPPEAFIDDGRSIKLKLGGKDHALEISSYLLSWLLPNFFFHVTTAYDLLRHKGVLLGKRHFLGPAGAS